MSEPSNREKQLQIIPVFALRTLLEELVRDEESESVMRAHIADVLGIKSQQSKKTIGRLNREDLVKLIAPHPEIEDEHIDELVGEYRYGRNPSFYIYLFSPSMFRGTTSTTELHREVEQYLDRFNQEQASAEHSPMVKEIHLNDLTPLPEKPEMMEATYRFLKRLEYVDSDENLVVTHETLYGFFWLNRVQGYWAIYQRLARVTKQLRSAIRHTTGIRLTPLAISKKFRDELTFLFKSDLRSGRLYDPDPESANYRFMSVTDEKPYRKGYAELEQRYPQIRNARYRISVGESKRTTLSIRYDRGALSLAGIFKGSEFRSWALARLDEIVEVLRSFQEDPKRYVATRDLLRVSPMQRLNVRQRKHVRTIIQRLLSLKQTGRDYAPLDVSPLAIASDLGRLVRAQVPLPLEDPEFQFYLTCLQCDRPDFIVSEQDGQSCLRCLRGHDPALCLPLNGKIEDGTDWSLDLVDLAERIELLPSDKLLQLMARVINSHLDPFTFDAEQESFLIRGNHVHYYASAAERPDAGGGPVQHINVNMNVGRVETGGMLIGVSNELLQRNAE